jgi:hypothetical protein
MRCLRSRGKGAPLGAFFSSGSSETRASVLSMRAEIGTASPRCFTKSRRFRRIVGL